MHRVGSYCTDITWCTVNKTLNLFNCSNCESCKLHEEIERIITDYSLYRLLSASILVTLVTKIVVNLTYEALHVQCLCSVLVRILEASPHICVTPPPQSKILQKKNNNSSWLVSCGRTDMNDEANNCFSQLCECTYKQWHYFYISYFYLYILYTHSILPQREHSVFT